MSAIRAERDYVNHADFMKVDPVKINLDFVEQLIAVFNDLFLPGH